MNNKITGVIILVAILCVIGVTSFLILNNNNENKQKNNSNNTVDNSKNGNNLDNTSTGKILVVYYSAQNHTKEVAIKIANNLSADTFEIVPKDEYTEEDLNYNNSNSRVSKEHDDESLRNVDLVSTKVDNWDEYETILIGYPIWWGIAAWPVDTFVTSNNFSGKTVIPFCTSASSGLGQSGELLKEKANSGNWLEGHRFSSNPTDSDIKSFTDSIK